MTRSTDTTLLHGRLREALKALNAALVRERIPLDIYEGWRSPVRQAALYAQGRGVGADGRTVTRARAWESYHQFGLAADYVFRDPATGAWSWSEPEAGMWAQYQRIAAGVGLESLSFEKPHVQVAGLRLAELRAGNVPPGGGDAWAANLAEVIAAWGGSPRQMNGHTHPPAPLWTGTIPSETERPPLDAG